MDREGFATPWTAARQASLSTSHSPLGRKELDTTERLMHACTQVILSSFYFLIQVQGKPCAH